MAHVRRSTSAAGSGRRHALLSRIALVVALLVLPAARGAMGEELRSSHDVGAVLANPECPAGRLPRISRTHWAVTNVTLAESVDYVWCLDLPISTKPFFEIFTVNKSNAQCSDLELTATSPLGQEYFDQGWQPALGALVRIGRWLVKLRLNFGCPRYDLHVFHDAASGGPDCGNGVLDPGEACDDGISLPGDCCSATCQLQNQSSDVDADGICDPNDNCRRKRNADQRDSDDDGRGDLCDECPALDASTCDADKTIARTVSPSGAILVVPDASVKLTVPPTTVEVNTSFSITGRSDSGYGLKITDKTPIVAEFEPAGRTFFPPVEIAFTWLDRNDNGYVDNPALTCPATARLGAAEREPCDLPVREEDLQIFRNGSPIATCDPGPTCLPGTKCAADDDCDRADNSWTISVPRFSEYVLGEPTCGAIGRPDLTVTNLATAPGDEKVTLKGNLVLDVPIDPPLDPITNGMTVLIETAGEKALLRQQLGGDAYDATTRRGWTKFPDRDTWTYRGRPPGVKTAKVSVLSAEQGKVKINLLARGLTLPALAAEDLPLRARVFVDGRCGDADFTGPAPEPECTFAADSSRLTCR